MKCYLNVFITFIRAFSIFFECLYDLDILKVLVELEEGQWIDKLHLAIEITIENIDATI